jgi:hypothetical protein
LGLKVLAGTYISILFFCVVAVDPMAFVTISYVIYIRYVTVWLIRFGDVHVNTNSLQLNKGHSHATVISSLMTHN